jgi:hypothetical protein
MKFSTSRLSGRNFSRGLVLCGAFLVPVAFLSPQHATGQTLAAGSIQGTIVDPTGAAVSGAKVTLTEPTTGFSKVFTTSSSGYYSAGSLNPGNYKIRVEAPGFSASEETITVQIGNSANGNLKLTVGAATQQVTVEGSAVEVNTEQTAIQGVLSQQEIQNLPTNGRNFLDLAQLQPGVQIQDGGNFDPTKNGFDSISFGGRYGRTARIELDGLDVSDENVGTTTQNISEDVIQEFQVAQSNLDISTSITSSGSVNLISRSGTNAVHGDVFYNFRDKRAGGANFPGGQNNYLQRNNPGAAAGGAFVPDKSFWFFSGEWQRQILAAPVVVSGPLAATSGNYSSPFQNLDLFSRFDFNLPHGARAFLRGNYDSLKDIGSYGGSNYSPFLSQNNTPSTGGGLDFLTGPFSHSIRIGYFKFVNHISDATVGTGIFNPTPGINLVIDQFSSGANLLAPQTTIQTNRQFRYDGSFTKQSHTLRYGVSYTRIGGGGLASFFGTSPEILSNDDPATVAYILANNHPFPSLDGNPTDYASNPANYPVGISNGKFTTGGLFGNGQGYSTALPKFGLPAGGLDDSRLAAYLGDNWKLTSRINVNYGLRYIHDTGRSDSKLPPLPILNNIAGLDPILGQKIHQPGSNFGPQAGVTWDPFGKGKTVVRAGAGLYYENNVWNNVYFDQPVRLSQGLFFGLSPLSCNGPGTTFSYSPTVSVSSIDGLDLGTQVCGQPAGTVAKALADLQKAYQAFVTAAGPQSNSNYINNALAVGPNYNGDALFYPKYKTPIAYQMNIGVQQEIAKNFVVTADFLRNVSVHTLLSIDENHVGDARYLDVAAGQAAIAKTVAGCGVQTVDEAIAACPGLHTTGGATITDFAGNGLDSAAAAGGGQGTGFAFAGINEGFGQLQFLKPQGRSTYDALQVSAHQHATHPIKGITESDITLAYSFSRFEGNQKDQDFGGTATDYNNPLKFFGPTGLDRTQQFSLSIVAQTYKALKISTITHINSSLPTTLSLVGPSGTAAGIFTSDVTGDGTTGDVLPGSNVGSYNRGIKPGDLTKVIANYNTKYAGTLSPAGVAVVNAGLLTATQLQQLGGTLESVPQTSGKIAGNDILRVFDVAASYPFKLGESLTIEPSAHAFNILNAANFDGPAGLVSGVLQGTGGVSANANNYDNRDGQRVGLGTGVFSFGAPRQFEFGLKMTF